MTFVVVSTDRFRLTPDPSLFLVGRDDERETWWCGGGLSTLVGILARLAHRMLAQDGPVLLLGLY